MANRWFTQFVSTLHKKPGLVDCNFVVDSTNGNGYGVRSLKGAGIAKVYMHTTASFTGTTNATTTISGISSGTSTFQIGAGITGTGIPTGAYIVSIPSSSSIIISAAATNSTTETLDYTAPGAPAPGGPASGLIYVMFQDNWNYYYGGFDGRVSPVSGTPISISTSSSLTIGNAYTIVSVGTTTLAQWQAVGVPVGTYFGSTVTGTPLLPTVGTTFIAIATSGSGTGVVETSVYSGVDHIEVIGDPNQTITSHSPVILGAPYQGSLAGGSGAYMVLQCFNAGSLAAPINGTVVGLTFYFSNSLIQVKGD
jgi:hypothetical protein